MNTDYKQLERIGGGSLSACYVRFWRVAASIKRIETSQVIGYALWLAINICEIF